MEIRKSLFFFQSCLNCIEGLLLLLSFHYPLLNPKYRALVSATGVALSLSTESEISPDVAFSLQLQTAHCKSHTTLLPKSSLFSSFDH